MAFARFRQHGYQAPPSVRIILYGLETAQDMTTTLRDLRRTVRLMQSGLVTLFPDEVSGLQLLYSTLDRDVMQVERSCQCITHQLLTALAEIPEDIVQLASFSSPACRGVWINRLYLIPAGPVSLTDGSGRYPVPLDAPFSSRCADSTDCCQPGWFHRCAGISSLPLSPDRSNFCAPTSESASNISTWTEASDGTDTFVRPVSQDTLLREVARALQPFVRIQILIQDPPNALVSDSTSELLSPSVVLL